MALTKHVYILSNIAGTVLYTGVTNNLSRRIFEHTEGSVPSFTRRYKVHRLVYYEATDDILSAIAREKQIKGGSRAKKLALINSLNPTWRDLAEDL